MPGPEDGFNGHLKQSGDGECEREARLITLVFNGIDRLPGDSQGSRQVVLSPASLRAQLGKTVLHRERNITYSI